MPTTQSTFVTTKAVDLHSIFNDVEEVYFKEGETESATDLATLSGVTELPVLSDGVTFNSGEANVTQIKLTTEVIWTSKATRGDSDISFNVPSIAGAINDLFMNKKVNSASLNMDSVAYAGAGYNFAPKKVIGTLVMPSNDKMAVLVLPKVEIYASFNAADGDNPAYFALKCTPLENKEGSELYILEKGATNQVPEDETGE